MASLTTPPHSQALTFYVTWPTPATGAALEFLRSACTSVPIAADRHGLADPHLDCRTRTVLPRATIQWDFCDFNALERNRYRGASGAEEFQRWQMAAVGQFC